ncbi:Rv1733c family protein [Mycobacterium intracellulare]|uniref:Rv1733c family protein n=1 Tax=Mycobacterium intracellulare TaxID=1767 RepID=UPI003D9EF2AC
MSRAGWSYGSRHSQYVREANQRHAVVATVTASGIDSADRFAVQASWPAKGGDRTGTIGLTTYTKVGQHVGIWLDKDGNPVDPPTPAWRALTGALATAMAMVLATGFATALLVKGIRARLDRARDAQWEDEIRCFQEDGGRTNQC